MSSNAPPTDPPYGSASAPTVPTASTTTMSAPLKRKYDDIVAALTLTVGGQAQAKRRKRAPSAVPTIEERLVSIGKYFVRAVHPFMDVSKPMLYGPEHHWSAPDVTDPSNTVVIPASELARQKLCITAFDKMFALAPDLLEVIKQLFLEIQSNPERWNALVKMLQKAATSARTSDTGGLKHCLDYVVPDPTKHVLMPPIPKAESKSDRGLAHAMLRYFLLPWKDRLQLPPLIMPTADGRGSVEPVVPEPVGGDSTEPTVPVARNELLERMVANHIELTANDFPSFFYAEGSFDPDDLDKGLLRGEFMLRVFRHIWTAPKSALFGLSDGRLPTICNARLHGAVVVVPEMVGYTGVQARTMLCTAEWKPRDGSFDYEALFTSIVQLFEDPEDPWAKDTLAWYQNPRRSRPPALPPPSSNNAQLVVPPPPLSFNPSSFCTHTQPPSFAFQSPRSDPILASNCVFVLPAFFQSLTLRPPGFLDSNCTLVLLYVRSHSKCFAPTVATPSLQFLMSDVRPPHRLDPSHCIRVHEMGWEASSTLARASRPSELRQPGMPSGLGPPREAWRPSQCAGAHALYLKAIWTGRRRPRESTERRRSNLVQERRQRKIYTETDRREEAAQRNQTHAPKESNTGHAATDGATTNGNRGTSAELAAPVPGDGEQGCCATVRCPGGAFRLVSRRRHAYTSLYPASSSHLCTTTSLSPPQWRI
ncbi:hypothetical protein C8R44DRAFT_917920 [Mycena epipterygia]|nr:hypothetical protein C8R44DRAFT_917920 [Mycena epipterygia]